MAIVNDEVRNAVDRDGSNGSSAWSEPARRLAPWLGGAGIALGHIAASVNCTVPQQGRCGACGSCVLVVGSLVGWAWAKRKRADDFYLDDGSSLS